MKISTKGRYALVIMLDLARNYKEDKFVTLNTISEEENISLKYLEKIMISLKKADFFVSTTGSNGGYKLKRKPEEYTIGEIIRASEENLDVVACITSEDACPRKGKCKTYPIWKELNDDINKLLDGKRLSDYL